jgi:hypothetical protein
MMSEIHHNPPTGLAMPQERSVTQERTVSRSRSSDLLSVTMALFVLLSTVILAVSLILRALGPKTAAAMVDEDYADPLMLNGPPRILMPLQTTRAVSAMPRLTIAPAPAPASRARTKRPAHHMALARADLYLPPLHHGTPNTFAPMGDWSEHGEFHSTTNCERFRSRAIADTIADRDQEPDDDRVLYDTRIKLLIAARCEGEVRD